VEFKRISSRLMILRVIVGKDVLNLVSVYAPQSGKTMEEKEDFFTTLQRIEMERTR